MDLKSFLTRVRKTKDCWEWIGSKRPLGYGVIHTGGKFISAHRLSWKLYFGEIPKGMYICHHCDNRACIRPDHLFLGTQKDNVYDAIKKHRMNPVGKKGHKSWNRNFTPEEAKKIREEYKTSGLGYKKLGKKYGVANTVIRNVIKELNWFNL